MTAEKWQELNNFSLNLTEGILLITVQRENKLNALNKEMVFNLLEIIKFIVTEDKIKGAIITGMGNKSFIAGGDIEEFSNLNEGELMNVIENGQLLTQSIENSHKPILAAVNGYAFGGGCEISMACHLRLASENALFSLPEIKLGMIPGYGGTQRITKLLGPARAIEIMLTGKRITSEKAVQLGLINRMVPQDQLLSESFKLMTEIINNPAVSISGILHSVFACIYESNGYEIEKSEFRNCARSFDFKEGTSAFLEKRRPLFKGK